MTVSLQDKLQRMKESKLIAEFKNILTCFECLSAVEASEFAPSLNQLIAHANRTDAPRLGKIACTEEQADIFSWVGRMFVASGIGVERFYLSTPYRFFPWLDCRVIRPEWVQNLNDVRDLNFSVISHDKTVFLNIANEEHWLDAYWCNL